MRFNLRRGWTALLGLPRTVKLTYCLLRDDRVPPAPKAALLAAIGLIVSPIDFPSWIPVLGELDMLALGVLAVRVFIEACPEPLVQEHRAALKRGDSIFDRDLGRVLAVAREQAREALRELWGRRRRRGRAPYQGPRVLEDESA